MRWFTLCVRSHSLARDTVSVQLYKVVTQEWHHKWDLYGHLKWTLDIYWASFVFVLKTSNIELKPQTGGSHSSAVLLKYFIIQLTCTSYSFYRSHDRAVNIQTHSTDQWGKRTLNHQGWGEGRWGRWVGRKLREASQSCRYMHIVYQLCQQRNQTCASIRKGWYILGYQISH